MPALIENHQGSASSRQEMARGVGVGLMIGNTDSTNRVARPALRYFGGKFMLARWILGHFPDHEVYVEPYCGGASVLLRKAPSPVEVINDLDEDVVTFFKVLRERKEELIRAIELTPFSRLEVIRAREGRRNPPVSELERARQFYVLSIQSMSMSGPSRQCSSGWRFQRSARNGNNAIAEWNNVDHLWAIADRLKGVFLECDDALKVIKRFDTGDTLCYIDPPYVASTRSHNRRGLYKYDMTDEQHRELADLLNGLRGMTVVSGYPSSLYDELYRDRGWERVCCSTTNNGGKTARECLWLSPTALRRQRQLRMELP
jgi:DNA adenine methylase